jgi:tetratricopeptide (TPR) repeat protein
MSLARPQNRLFAAAVLLSVLMVHEPARGAAAEDKAKAAKKACIAGDYAKGVELLSDLYVETNDPNYVFNQGRCFEQSGRYQDAINRFLEYVRRLKDAGKSADPKVERHIADCQAMLDKESRPVPAATPAETAVAPVPAPAPVVAPAPVAVARDQSTQAGPAVSAPGSGLRVVGLAVAGLGVAGLATGLILNLKANQLTDDLQRSDLSYSRSQDATRSSYKTWGWVSYGVGAACVVGGAVLYFVGRSQAAGSQVALVPVAGPGQVGVAAQGGF